MTFTVESLSKVRVNTLDSVWRVSFSDRHKKITKIGRLGGSVG